MITGPMNTFQNISNTFFSLPEPKAQVSFSDQDLSVVRRCCCKLFTLSSSSKFRTIAYTHERILYGILTVE